MGVLLWWSQAVGMCAKAGSVGQRAALSTDCAGARERIVHMSTAFPGLIDLLFSPCVRERA